MTINSDISDLFYSRDFDHCTNYNAEEQYAGFDLELLYTEAEEFLASLGRLGVTVPDAADLVADFLERA